MNNMNYGNSSSPAPTIPNAQQGMDLSLPQTDAQAVEAPDFSVKGNVGSDWQAGFNKWVYAHLYYPDAAARQGQQGDVTVEFTAHRDGSVTGLHLISGSGSNFLDLAWEGIFAQNQLPPFPPGGDDTVDITATVHYIIEPP
jgi:TonB family protein